MMTIVRLMVVAVAVVGAALVVAASAADAAPRKKMAAKRAVGNPSTVFTSRDETGRTRTRIIVQKRSYLDGGTEIMPGDISGATLYINPPTQRPSSAVGLNEVTNPPGPIPSPWYLPGKDNPWPWFVN
jgi:hypothetical protein